MVFVKEVSSTIESIGPSTIALPVLPTQVLAPRWVIKESSSGLMNSMKARELLLVFRKYLDSTQNAKLITRKHKRRSIDSCIDFDD